ncbi:methyltransferase domain-containing protein [Magnetovibrio blakemorei]|uniref:SAM-dependent methyltransferase n=1 Tax=Magnetovibrio blakemorei TaxID=28181 RepID=A0A1E5Q710_9PROT|nr:methyltransferase domain-containing protein [Magnetovibrio blakemorei]OEJ66725.1 SAM-dependent methyltransferase [Magnetovibrio blakemorei]
MATPPHMALFERHAVRLHRNRAAALLDDHDFLFVEVADRLTERLDDVKRDFPLALDIGCHGGEVARSLTQGDHRRGNIETLIQCDPSPAMAQKAANGEHSLSFAADEEFLPIKPESFDLVLSNLSLHWANDLTGALVQIRQSLKPDGLFLAAMLGEGTLQELRTALMAAEIEIEMGMSPRVSPYATVQDLGGLLQRAGFAMPVVDTETITVSYPDIFKLMHDLRGMGETGAVSGRRKTFTRKDTLMRAAEIYVEKFAGQDDCGEGRIPATFDIIYLTAWSPHPDQQKPLQPGSAQTSLTQVLGDA